MRQRREQRRRRQLRPRAAAARSASSAATAATAPRTATRSAISAPTAAKPTAKAPAPTSARPGRAAATARSRRASRRAMTAPTTAPRARIAARIARWPTATVSKQMRRGVRLRSVRLYRLRRLHRLMCLFGPHCGDSGPKTTPYPRRRCDLRRRLGNGAPATAVARLVARSRSALPVTASAPADQAKLCDNGFNEDDYNYPKAPAPSAV